ncbi:TadE/TadG family type IV pilus assembly protein [Sphingomonas panacisoli]|nr:TadE family protein [Sphingomonas panacisoli]
MTSVLRCRRGSAAVEMALIVPVFLFLAFGAVDLGNYFLSEHAVVVAVRDGARYAARRYPLACTATTNDTTSTTAMEVRNLVRTNTIASGGQMRINNWSDASTITVAISCNTSGTYNTGIYTGVTNGVPIVTVTASVPYTSLFNAFGFTTASVNLNAQAQASVMGA